MKIKTDSGTVNLVITQEVIDELREKFGIDAVKEIKKGINKSSKK